MHDSVALHNALRRAIKKETDKPTKLMSANKIYPTYDAYVVLAQHGEDNAHGTRYLVLVNGDKCEAAEIDFYTPKIDWDIRLGDEADVE